MQSQYSIMERLEIAQAKLGETWGSHAANNTH